MQNTTNTQSRESAQIHFLLTTVEKKTLLEDYDAAVTTEDLPTISTDIRKHWMQTETHRTRVMPLTGNQMTYEQSGYIYALGCELDMYDAVVNWLTYTRSRLDAERYISYLEQRYLTSKQAA